MEVYGRKRLLPWGALYFLKVFLSFDDLSSPSSTHSLARPGNIIYDLCNLSIVFTVSSGWTYSTSMSYKTQSYNLS